MPKKMLFLLITVLPAAHIFLTLKNRFISIGYGCFWTSKSRFLDLNCTQLLDLVRVVGGRNEHQKIEIP